MLLVFAAESSADVFCVAASNPDSLSSECTPGQGKTTVAAALSAASARSGADKVLIGPGTWSESNLTVSDNDSLVISGSGSRGANRTTLTAPNSVDSEIIDLYTDTSKGITLRDLRVLLPVDTSVPSDIGILATESVIDSVVVEGSDADDRGVYMQSSILKNSSISMNMVSGAIAVDTGDIFKRSSLIEDVDLEATVGVYSGIGLSTTVRRANITSSWQGVVAYGSQAPDTTTLLLESSLIKLTNNPGAQGVVAETYFNGNQEAVGAVVKGVTIVGGGSNSKAIRAASYNSGDSTAMDVSGAVVSGAETEYQAFTSFPGATLSASLAYSYANPARFDLGAPLDLTLGAGNILASGSPPGFVGNGDYSLLPNSQLIDVADPAWNNTIGPSEDIDGLPRVLDGKNICQTRADIGAYEYLPANPSTSFTLGPSEGEKISNKTPTFEMSSSRACQPVFVCSIDGASPTSCQSPFTTPALSNGTHTVSVAAIGQLGGAGPATIRNFSVQLPLPDTSILGSSKFRAGKGKARVSLKIVSDQPDSTFSCRLNQGAWRNCASIYRAHLSIGRYTLQARAKNINGSDSTPAKKSFRVVR